PSACSPTVSARDDRPHCNAAVGATDYYTREVADMARAKHPCREQGCTVPCPPGVSRCPEHTRAHDRARGTTAQRGYGTSHQRLRRALSPIVQAGRATCWRCGLPIAPDEAWDLGHDDEDRTITRGPEHAYTCNRSAAGRAAHGLAPHNGTR